MTNKTDSLDVANDALERLHRNQYRHPPNQRTRLLPAELMRFINLAKAVGFDINHQNEEQHSALHVASYKGDVIGIKRLLKAGADVNLKSSVPDSIGTPIICAAWSKHAEACRLLIEHGGNPWELNSINRDALYYAILADGNSDELTGYNANPCVPLLFQQDPDFKRLSDGELTWLKQQLKQLVALVHRDSVKMKYLKQYHDGVEKLRKQLQRRLLLDKGLDKSPSRPALSM